MGSTVKLAALLCILSSQWVGSNGAAWASPKPAAPAQDTRFDIPSQPLAEALSTFAAQTGLQMLYDAPLATGRRSTAVSGGMSPRSALAMMLQGTGLSARFTSAGAVVVYASATSAVTLNPLTAVAAPVVGGDRLQAAFLAYAEVARKRISDHVRGGGRLTDAGYRISIRLWVAEDGRPIRADILSGSQDLARDQRFLDRVMSAPLPAPPSGLPQPMRIEFSVRPGN